MVIAAPHRANRGEQAARPALRPYLWPQGDHATAAISHLPHIIAYSLVNLVKDLDDNQETMKTIAAGGFRDLTRIASSSPIMWQNICLSNQEQVLELIDNYVDALNKTRADIANADGGALLADFQSAKDYRDSFQIKKKGLINKVYEIYLDLIDEAGKHCQMH